MSTEITRLHYLIAVMDAQGAWGMAEHIRNILAQTVKETSASHGNQHAVVQRNALLRPPNLFDQSFNSVDTFKKGA